MPADSVYPFGHFSDHLLRRKDAPFVDDPDWATLALSPDVVLIEVGGVATAGDYSVQVVPDPAAGLPTPDLVDFTRVAETNDGIATGLVAASGLELALTLEPYYSAVSIATAAGLNYVGLTLKRNAPGHTLTLVAPGAGTLIAEPDGYFPLAATMSNVKPADGITRDAVAVAFVAVDGTGVVLPDDNGCTFSVQTVRTVERRTVYDGQNAPSQPVGVTGSAVELLHEISKEYRVPLDGGRWGVRLSAIVTPPTGATGIELRYRYVGT